VQGFLFSQALPALEIERRFLPKHMKVGRVG
jgi:hypothetical protein